MNQFLFVVEIPPNETVSSAPGYQHKWIQFEDGANSIPKPRKAYTRRQRNVWLIPEQGAWPYLSAMSNLALKLDLSYSVSLISGDVTHLKDSLPNQNQTK